MQAGVGDEVDAGAEARAEISLDPGVVEEGEVARRIGLEGQVGVRRAARLVARCGAEDIERTQPLGPEGPLQRPKPGEGVFASHVGKAPGDAAGKAERRPPSRFTPASGASMPVDLPYLIFSVSANCKPSRLPLTTGKVI